MIPFLDSTDLLFNTSTLNILVPSSPDITLISIHSELTEASQETLDSTLISATPPSSSNYNLSLEVFIYGTPAS